jgi:hypothetical protein
MTLRLNGSTSGYVEIDAPATAGSNTLVLPTGNGSADQALVTNGSGTLSFADRGRMVQGTAQASTSGTSIDFTGIPSWAKRVTVMFNGVSTNGTSPVQVQLGDSGGFATTGYVSTSGSMNSTGIGSAAYSTSGCVLRNAHTAAFVYSGHIVFSLLSSNTFTHTGQFSADTASSGSIVMGSKALSATLDRIRITTVNGTDTFDAGTINIMYEG